MFAVRNIIKAACVNIAQRAGKATLRPLSSYCGILQNSRPSLLSSVQKSVLGTSNNSLLNITPGLLTINNPATVQQERTLIKYSLTRGKKRTVKAPLKKFYRLHWGIWIRTRCGRHRKLYTKSSKHKRRLLQHVFCNAQQSWLLDKMVSKYWKLPKYYVDDPYEPYHKREEYGFTRRTPLPKTEQ